MKDAAHKKAAKKKYEKPEVVFTKRIEVISAQCNSGWGIGGGCQTPGNGACVRTKSA